MDGRGGCCIARYAGGAGAYDMSKIDRIMLRFRPIAPKPATASSFSGGSSSPEMSEVSPRCGRGKRRSHTSSSNSNNGKRCNNGNRNRKRKRSSEEKVDAAVTTLPLLPETPDRKTSPARESQVGLLSPKQAQSVPKLLSFGGSMKDHDYQMMASEGFGVPTDHRTVVMPRVMRVVGSCVTVESVTDTWVDVNGLGCTDEERKVNLERDTCPGFISDGFGRVTWTNGAYRKMVSQGDDGGDMVVWLVMKESVPVTVTLASYWAFTCRVRVQYQNTCGNGKEKSSITVPCDVWRMDGGGFAWRLDVKAALCLGR